MKICVTGHRPNKLNWGYNYSNTKWLRLKDLFKEYIVENKVTDVYTGMALGVDTIMALVVLELKNEGYNVRLHCVLPCATQCLTWPEESIELYLNILEKADAIIGVSYEDALSLKLVRRGNAFKFELKDNTSVLYTTNYSRELMQKRNRYMVDNTSAVVAVWDGSPGGTGNCVKYAMGLGRNIFNFRPINI